MNKNTYVKLKDTWSFDKNSKENFFVSYALRGPMLVPSYGLRGGLPVNHPITGPVSEPSILNTRYVYHPPDYVSGVLMPCTGQ